MTAPVRHQSGVWVANDFSFLKMRARHRTVTLPSGERAKITVDDSGTVRHVEHGDVLDAVVRPAAIHLRLVAVRPGPSVTTSGRPAGIRARTVIPRR